MSEMETPRIGTLMLIDDNEVDQMLYERVIDRSDLVASLVKFQMADEALEYLLCRNNPRPDLILLDINMPRMDGFEFLDAATAELGDEFSTVVVMLTTSLDPRDAERAAQYSAVKDYLTKPLTKAQLEKVATLV